MLSGVSPPSSSNGPPRSNRDGPRHGKGTSKSFELPDKKKQQQLAEQATVEEKKSQLSQEQLKGDQKISDVKATESTEAVKQITQLVQRMVTEMRVGQNMASMRLSETESPSSFAGSNLTVSMTENGLSIKVDEFMTPQQENQAILLVEKNKEQLVQMAQALQAKNIQVHDFTIGRHVVEIPRVEPLPPPFQPPPSTQAESEGGQRERGGEEEGDGPTE